MKKIMMFTLMLFISIFIQAKNNSGNYSIFSDLTPEVSNYWSVLSLERLNTKITAVALKNISDISKIKFKELDGSKNIIEYEQTINLNQCVILLANQMMHQLVEIFPYADVVKRTKESVKNDTNKINEYRSFCSDNKYETYQLYKTYMLKITNFDDLIIQ